MMATFDKVIEASSRRQGMVDAVVLVRHADGTWEGGVSDCLGVNSADCQLVAVGDCMQDCLDDLGRYCGIEPQEKGGE